jgi:hypothetical protein
MNISLLTLECAALRDSGTFVDILEDPDQSSYCTKQSKLNHGFSNLLQRCPPIVNQGRDARLALVRWFWRELKVWSPVRDWVPGPHGRESNPASLPKWPISEKLG